MEDEDFLPFQEEISIPYGTLSPIPPHVSTPQSAGLNALRFASITSDDYLLDLGCGDAKFLIEAAKEFHMKGLGIDIIPELIVTAKENAKKEKVDHLIEAIAGDFTSNFAWARDDITIIYIYLLPQIFKASSEFVKKLEEMLKSGKRVVCYHYPIPGWTPTQVDNTYGIYLYNTKKT